MDQIIEIIVRGGPTALAAVMFWLLLQERQERRESQDKLLQVSLALIESTTKTEATLAGFATLLENVGKMLQEVKERLRNGGR